MIYYFRSMPTAPTKVAYSIYKGYKHIMTKLGFPKSEQVAKLDYPILPQSIPYFRVLLQMHRIRDFSATRIRIHIQKKTGSVLFEKNINQNRN